MLKLFSNTIHHPTHTLNHLGDTLSILDSFLTCNHLAYSFILFFCKASPTKMSFVYFILTLLCRNLQPNHLRLNIYYCPLILNTVLLSDLLKVLKLLDDFKCHENTQKHTYQKWNDQMFWGYTWNQHAIFKTYYITVNKVYTSPNSLVLLRFRVTLYKIVFFLHHCDWICLCNPSLP